MTLQTPFFGKRPAESLAPRSPQNQPPSPTHNQPAGMSGGATASGPTPLAAPPAAAPVATVTTATATPSGAPTKEGGSKLTVGPNIKLKGVEITDCDTLVVEGTVEATMDSRVMHITEIGAFKGSAEVDYAEIHGAFSGDLTVREKLVIYATGRVNGKIRYGKLVIEEGGQMMGDIQFGAAPKSKELPAPKMGMATAV
ncbi:MAG: polymer-forming cytoskeletal protein [Rhodoferax sp.]|nr:polymer-forming cytoskeletal protein [Rhodoferax sp.]